jgi:hypothetical protein
VEGSGLDLIGGVIQAFAWTDRGISLYKCQLGQSVPRARFELRTSSIESEKCYCFS